MCHDGGSRVPPGCQAWTIALTLFRHGIETGLPVSSTTIVLGFASATASMTASCPHGSDESALSKPSPPTQIPEAITTSERFAVNAASAGVYPGSKSNCALGSAFFSSSSGDGGNKKRLR